MASYRLTTVQFQDAVGRYLDTSKPDPLVKKQIEQLKLSWEQLQVSTTDVVDNTPHHQWKLDGTLTVSSEYISIAIHVKCSCNVKNVDKDTEQVVVNNKVNTQFDEFYFQLKVTGTLLPEVKEVDGEPKLSSKERRAKSTLHAGIIKRLQSDKFIRNLLSNEGVLCEALIQQSANCTNQLEERVNVNEDVLSGIKNAIFSHVEDNLDVFDLLLSMPYLPRSSGRDGPLDSAVPSDLTTQGLESGTSKVHDMLGDRAYLRLLEDAMFDACEKEGEDEILDDLNISCGSVENDDCGANEDGKRRRK